ncbi:Svf1p [Sugiyamaella lignohabitans]|uniref:Svf1p n=1 Tax=Sugiyamaella lignohabitans TaxID=796027 RepID=A0A167D4Q9_9ASCO|nr:Svf1p [Sugiyamaella lignohabitans]ANB12475.1 Svf1p [Sugiyamaella lignohabitans]
MLKWVQGGSVDKTVENKNPYGKLTKDDLSWKAPYSSNVETQTFYFHSQSGYYGFVQVIHSNPVGIHFTAQFTCLVVNDSKPDFKVWTSTHLENFVAKGTEFTADGLSISLNESEDEYTITSVVNEESLVELKIKRESDGFKIGADGTSVYGEDLNNPWGSMRHVFWPRCLASGKIVVNSKGNNGTDNVDGSAASSTDAPAADRDQLEIAFNNESAMYVMALQGMKPHHAAAKWNFLNFQGPTISAVVMQFTTPPSYGDQTSSVGGIVKDGKLIATAVDCQVEHQETKVDEVGWPAPHKIEFKLAGPKIETPDAEIGSEPAVTAQVYGALDKLVDRVDVMAEIPSFVKRVVSGVSGAKPYIYQYKNKLTIKLSVDGKDYEEDGYAFSEATFIS